MEPDNNPLLNNPNTSPVPSASDEATTAPIPPSPQIVATVPSPALRAAAGRVPAKPNPGIRETLETVILALILAFTFRTFCVEAFVIPTGSMAPTLSGAHFRAVCTMCGYNFNVNANVDQQWLPVRDPETGQVESTLVRLNNGELTDPNAIPAPNYAMCHR